MDNTLYNIMTQITQEQKSLWRIENKYMGDADEHGDAKALWEEIAAAKREHVAKLTEEMKKHLG